MKIFKYQQWLEESEEVPPVAPTPAPSTDTLPEAPAETPAAPAEDPLAGAPAETPEMPAETPAEAPADAPEYEKLDTARKDAIRAFKAKFEEYKNAPEDQKETMKEETNALYKAMEEAVKAFDEYVAKEIGAEANAPEIDDEP